MRRRAPGYLVCAGDTEVPAKDPKRAKVWEAHFGGPSKNRRHLLPASVVELFHILHSDPGRNKREPRRGNWRWWLARMDYLGVFNIERKDENPERAPQLVVRRGIPVFFHGTPPEMTDLGSQSPSEAARHSFFFSLSRVMRLPWPYSVGEVVQRLYQEPGAAPAAYVVPKLEDPNGWDFARALFGEVEEAMTDVRSRDRPEVPPGASHRTNALAGRVAFAPAFAEGAPEPRPQDRKTGVLGTPRESFYPFYLRRDPRTGGASGASYAHDYAVPAGRKRYVARSQPAALPPGNENERTQSTVDFLPKNTRFTGRIRFHNLHPVELGALLWALTLGGPGGPYRHFIGRAKAHGYGALKAEVRFVRPPTMRNTAIDSDQAKQFGTYMELFKAHMEDALDRPESYEEWPEICTLKRLADPTVGKAAAAHGLLATGDLEQDHKKWKKAAPATEDGWPYGLPSILGPLP